MEMTLARICQLTKKSPGNPDEMLAEPDLVRGVGAPEMMNLGTGKR